MLASIVAMDSFEGRRFRLMIVMKTGRSVARTVRSDALRGVVVCGNCPPSTNTLVIPRCTAPYRVILTGTGCVEVRDDSLDIRALLQTSHAGRLLLSVVFRAKGRGMVKTILNREIKKKSGR